MKQLLFMLLLIIITYPITAQQDDTIEISPELIAHLDQLDVAVSQLRELDILADVERRFPTRQDVIDFVMQATQEELDVQTVLEQTQFYIAFDFVSPEFDLVATYTTLLADQVAGFYDPETGIMNVLLTSPDAVLEDELPILEQLVYVHEYTHALQDQHFDLLTYLEDVTEPDASLAALALVEGDATLVMQDYTLLLAEQDPLALLALLDDDLLLDAEMPAGTPAVLEAELTMPYFDGLLFVMALHRDGGWDSVDAAYANPPVSTEQIFHPEKYLAGEMPIAVSLPPVELGEGWEQLMDYTLGEFYLREYLNTQVDRSTAINAAAGWGGDRMNLYYNADRDARAWVIELVMDTPEDAVEFKTAYMDFILGRLPESTVIGDCYTTQAETLCLLDVDDTTLKISYAPEVALARQLLDNS